jgi:P27 family predicted phage terminase small subunit
MNSNCYTLNMGRTRKPTALRLLEGNRSKTPLPTGEVLPGLASLRAPGWLPDGARKVWRKYAPAAQRLGVLTELDVQHFATWCVSAADFIEATARLEADGALTRNGLVMQASPYHAIRAKAVAAMLRFGQRFGMDPASRAALAVAGEGEPDEFDLWERENEAAERRAEARRNG